MTTLYIDRSNSMCGACSRNADPSETSHFMRHMEGDGCGALYTSLASHYHGIKDACMRMRPDLPWVGIDETQMGGA